ncbi:MAG: sigma-70 family RNA polymerase sigma factor [Myxococcales bacterium]|nr:sigma-70 family RNA polymerase sigma factor [Myxococcales bacterium]
MKDDDSESTLLAAWRGGDQGAGQALVRRYWADLYRFFAVATRGDHARAEELTQETFYTVVRRRERIEASFRAYCYGVARMKRFEAARQRLGAFEPLDELALEVHAAASPEDRLRSKLVVTVLRRLSPDDQLFIVLKDYLGFTQAELAEAFKIPQGRVAGRLNRARRRFRREFERLEIAQGERELTMRSLNTALASIVARLPRETLAPRSQP